MAGLDSALAGVVTWIQGNLLVDVVRVERPAGGDPVLDPATGRLTNPEPDIVYEGIGAVVSTGAPGGINALPSSTLPWVQETTSPARLLTPLDAPIPARDDIVTVVEVHNPANTALIGRTWVCQDPGRASTVEVVRTTPLDMKQAARTEPGGG
jgi:hypothetical protein